jgi:hypothetical protein
MTTTPYSVSTGKGSQGFDGFVNTPINGPLTTNRYPFSMMYHSYGTLVGQRQMPPQFFPGQEPINASMNTNARSQYRATAISNVQKAKEDALGKKSEPISKVNYSSGRQIPVSSHVNYVAPIQSSMHLDKLKSQAIGKGAYQVGASVNTLTSSKNYSVSSTKSALQRARSSGCTAPKKKGAIRY